MRKKAWTFGILTGLLLSVLCPFTVQAQIASPQAFQNLSWKMVKEEPIETEHGVVQSICATDDYIVCLENVLDGSGQPDIVKAYYRNDKDKNGNPVEQYSLAMQVQETDYEHANGMAYNPNTNEIAVSLYTSYQKENRGCLFIMDADTLKFKRKVKVTDEPTGALDYNTGKAILKLLQEMCREKGMTVIVITHNSALAPMADRLIKIKNGKVSSMKVNENPISIDEIEW